MFVYSTLSDTHAPVSGGRLHFHTILGSKPLHASPELFSRSWLLSNVFKSRVLWSSSLSISVLFSSGKVFRSHSDM